MTLKILESAVEDLERGRRFYSRHGQGVGVYFLDSLFSDIDSLLLGYTRDHSDTIVSYPNDFPLLSTISSRTTWLSSTGSSTCDRTLSPFATT